MSAAAPGRTAFAEPPGAVRSVFRATAPAGTGDLGQEANHTQVHCRNPRSATGTCESPDPSFGLPLQQCLRVSKLPPETVGRAAASPPVCGGTQKLRTLRAPICELFATREDFDNPACDLLKSEAQLRKESVELGAVSWKLGAGSWKLTIRIGEPQSGPAATP